MRLAGLVGMGGMVGAGTRAIVELRWLGLALLLVTLALGVWMVPGTIAALEPGGFEVSGGRVERVEATLAERFDTARADLLLLVEADDGVSLARGAGAERLASLRERLGEQPAVGQVLGPETLPSALGRDPSEALVLVALVGDERAKQRAVAAVEDAARSVAGLAVTVGGEQAADVTAQALAHADLRRAELFALPVALVILLIYFRRPIPALLPGLVGGFAITASFPVLRALAAISDASLFALNIVVFLGLGLAVDYSLFIVQRQREELAVGNPVAVALARTLATAGKTVLFSGVAVIVSLLALAWVPISLLRSVALGGTLVVGLANVGALVILPALLALLGPRVAGRGLLGGGAVERRLIAAHRHSTGGSAGAGGPGAADPQALHRPRASGWARIAGAVMRRPGLVAALVAGLLLVFGAPVLRIQTATADARIFPPASEVHRVHAAASDPDRFEVDPSATHLLLVRTRGGGPVLAAEPLAALDQLGARLQAIPGVEAVTGLPTLPLPEPLASLPPAQRAAWLAGEPVPGLPGVPARLQRELEAWVDGDATLVRVTSQIPPSSPAAREQLAAIEAAASGGLELELAGLAARARELDAALRERLPWAASTVALASFAVLVLAFGAPIVALKAVVMNALSLTASFGALVWVFQDGRFEQLLGYRSFGTIEPTVPVMMFALVFGLSMDYELFLLSRVREAWLRGRDLGGDHGDDPSGGRESVGEGLTRTGPIITTAAAILIVVVLGLAGGTLVFMKQLGIGMALAILLDATLIRLLLVPATMALLGRWNWWTPAWLARARAALRLELREGEAERVEAHSPTAV